jgi:hypothetical protein
VLVAGRKDNNASELSRVAVVSARDMKPTGHAVPHNTPPNRQGAVYMIAFTVADASEPPLRFGMTSPLLAERQQRQPR